MTNTKQLACISLFFTCSIFANNASPTIADIVKNIGQNNDTALKLLLEKEKKDLQANQKSNKKHMAIGAGETAVGILGVLGVFIFEKKMAGIYNKVTLPILLASALALWDGAPRLIQNSFEYFKHNEKRNHEIKNAEAALETLKLIKVNTHD